MRRRSLVSTFIYESSENYSVKLTRKIYNVWAELEKRCYIEKYNNKYPSYRDCTVHKDWHNFQVFAKWYEENYVEDWQLDKDILVSGNKIYGPETCCFVPRVINMQFRTLIESIYGFGVSFHRECKTKPFILRLETEE